MKFVKELADTEALEEDTVELTVEVTKPNQKVKWIRNGRTVNPNEDRFAGRYLFEKYFKHIKNLQNIL